jgi:hypothetical protein
MRPTANGERRCLPQARLAGGEPSAQRDMNAMHRPIRHRLFGGILGRQACAAGVGCKPPPGGKRSAQCFPNTKGEAKGGKAPLGHISPRSAMLRMSLPATIR